MKQFIINVENEDLAQVLDMYSPPQLDEIIPKILIETIITCPEEDIGNHSNNPCSIAIIIYSIIYLTQIFSFLQLYN